MLLRVNLRDEDVERFRTKHADFVPKVLTIENWTEGTLKCLEQSGHRIVSVRALALAETLRSSGPKEEELRARDILRLIWRGHDDANDYLKILLAGSHMRCDWKRAELVYEPENDFEQATSNAVYDLGDLGFDFTVVVETDEDSRADLNLFGH